MSQSLADLEAELDAAPAPPEMREITRTLRQTLGTAAGIQLPTRARTNLPDRSGIIELNIPPTDTYIGVEGVHLHLYPSRTQGSGMRIAYGPIDNRWRLEYERTDGGIGRFNILNERREPQIGPLDANDIHIGIQEPAGGTAEEIEDRRLGREIDPITLQNMTTALLGLRHTPLGRRGTRAFRDAAPGVLVNLGREPYADELDELLRTMVTMVNLAQEHRMYGGRKRKTHISGHRDSSCTHQRGSAH